MITGAAGFVGFHSALQLHARGDAVLGLDNFNDYYDVRLKYNRESILREKGERMVHVIELPLACTIVVHRISSSLRLKYCD